MSATDWNDKLAVLGYTADSSKLYCTTAPLGSSPPVPENDLPRPYRALTTIGTDGKHSLANVRGLAASPQAERLPPSTARPDANSFEQYWRPERHAPRRVGRLFEGTFLVTNGYKLDVYMTVNRCRLRAY